MPLPAPINCQAAVPLASKNRISSLLFLLLLSLSKLLLCSAVCKAQNKAACVFVLMCTPVLSQIPPPCFFKGCSWELGSGSHDPGAEGLEQLALGGEG